MTARKFATLMLFLVGFALGCFVTALFAQRGSYFWAGEQLSRTSSVLEREAKALAASGRRDEAREKLMSALQIRQSVSALEQQDQVWALDMPAGMFLETLLNPSRPSIDTKAVLADPAVLFMYECALLELPPSSQQSEASQARLNDVVRRYAQTDSAKCSAVGKGFWSK